MIVSDCPVRSKGEPWALSEGKKVHFCMEKVFTKSFV